VELTLFAIGGVYVEVEVGPVSKLGNGDDVALHFKDGETRAIEGDL